MLSHFINDLMEILDQYGDKHVCVEDDTGEFNTVSFKENEMYKLCFRSWNDNEEWLKWQQLEWLLILILQL